MSSTPQVLEHGSSRPGRWLREHRLRAALWIAVAEGLLTIVGVIPKWFVFLLALLALALWWFVGRHRHDTARHATWIFATSQLLVVLVPAAIVILGTVAVVVISLIAVAALVVLFTERR